MVFVLSHHPDLNSKHTETLRAKPGAIQQKSLRIMKHMIEFYPLLGFQAEAGPVLRMQLVTAEGAHGAVTSATGTG